ncbi:family 10 glycosylhydrolase [Serratia oryzae]|uniref:family 10 glycosylhydrolase n=1 Tax=Serratia oryzae TaxID=2034155 RepID=UPI0012E29FD8|nr:family 10 glycosylhydrolase [Serratia oryzae]
MHNNSLSIAAKMIALVLASGMLFGCDSGVTTTNNGTPTTDTGSTDNNNTDSNTTDNGSTDNGNTDNGNTDNGNTDNGNTDNGNTDNGNTDNGNTDNGNTDNGNTDNGNTDKPIQTYSPLYKYVKNSDGVYGYDSNLPVDLYKGANQFISIPDNYIAPKHAFRSAWVATIGNLNMPFVNSEQAFKQTYLNILDRFSALNMNAMIFQIRPMLDAYYSSEINPWSQYLSGKQGKDPGYDPLTWMVEQTHERGMEYHAWFNPYRVTNAKITSLLKNNSQGLSSDEILALSTEQQIGYLVSAGIMSSENFAAKNPQWVLSFDEKLFLNPAIPEVIEHVVSTVEEVVRRYDVDAIHFDDYFYPYRITVNGATVQFGAKGEDRAAFETYGLVNNQYPDTPQGIEDWRRDNVTRLISRVQSVIAQHNQQQGTAVQFGISPFGIWEHKGRNELGSNTPLGSSQSYSGSIFADTRKWVKEELVDYVVPQIYWSFDQAAAPYGELASWWNNQMEGSHTQLYIGHANYKHVSNGSSDAAWMNPEEIPNQMRYNQDLSYVSGSVFFSYNDLLVSNVASQPVAQQGAYGAKNAAIEKLSQTYLSTPTLPPSKPWLDQKVTTLPQQARFVSGSKNAFSWADSPDNDTRYYVVYRGSGKSGAIFADPKNIIAKVWRGKANTFSYQDNNAVGEGYTYLISAVDAAQNETAPVTVKVD